MPFLRGSTSSSVPAERAGGDSVLIANPTAGPPASAGATGTATPGEPAAASATTGCPTGIPPEGVTAAPTGTPAGADRRGQRLGRFELFGCRRRGGRRGRSPLRQRRMATDGLRIRSMARRCARRGGCLLFRWLLPGEQSRNLGGRTPLLVDLAADVGLGRRSALPRPSPGADPRCTGRTAARPLRNTIGLSRQCPAHLKKDNLQLLPSLPSPPARSQRRPGTGSSSPAVASRSAIGSRNGRIPSSVRGPMPRTRRRSSRSRNGPLPARSVTIRLANCSPIPGNSASSGQSAWFTSTLEFNRDRLGPVDFDHPPPQPALPHPVPGDRHQGQRQHDRRHRLIRPPQHQPRPGRILQRWF